MSGDGKNNDSGTIRIDEGSIRKGGVNPSQPVSSPPPPPPPSEPPSKSESGKD